MIAPYLLPATPVRRAAQAPPGERRRGLKQRGGQAPGCASPAPGAAAALCIVLVERHAVLRAGLDWLLAATAGLTVSGIADSLAAAERLPAQTAADVVLVGTDLHDLAGTAGIARLRSRFARAHIVLIGPVSEAGWLVEAIRAGADGYVSRDTSPAGLVRALQGISQGEAALPRTAVAELIAAVRCSIPPTGAAHAGDSSGACLSRREREVLQAMAVGHSNAAIARRLGLRESTVKTHVSNVLRKTGARSRFVLQPASVG